MPFFQTGDVKAASLHLVASSQWLSDFGVAQSRVWKPGVTCITIAANIAESAVLGVEGCFPDSVVAFSPALQAEDAYFVKYLLDYHRSRLSSVAQGTTQENLSVEKLVAHRFAVPDPVSRRSIVEVLGSIDRLIENTTRRIELLEGIVQATYREWFVHFRYPGHERVPLVASVRGPIPAGWTAKVLGDLATEVREAVEPSASTRALPYVPIDSINPRSLTLRTFRPGSEAASSLRRFETGDVLFGAMRAYFHKVAIAPFNGLTRSTCFVLRPHSDCGHNYVAVTLSQEATVAYAAAHSSGSTIPYARWLEALSEMPALLPTADVVAMFEDLAEPCIQECQRLAALHRILQQLRDLLLPRLLGGLTEVSAVGPERGPMEQTT